MTDKIASWREVFPDPTVFDTISAQILDELVLVNPLPSDRGPSTRWQWMFLCKKAGLITPDEYRNLVNQAHGREYGAAANINR